MYRKTEPEHDSCRTNLLIFFMGMHWEIAKLILTLEMATLGAWYYLLNENNYFLAFLLLLISSSFIYCAHKVQIRYSHLSQRANDSLKIGGDIYLNVPPTKKFKTKIGGITWAKYFSILALAINLILILHIIIASYVSPPFFIKIIIFNTA